MDAEHSGQMTHEAPHGDVGLRGGFPTKTVLILFRADVGSDKEQPGERGGRADKADTLRQVGLTCSDLGEWRGALECFKVALPIYQEIKDRKGEALSLYNIGRAHEGLGEWQQALDCLKPALEIFQDKEIGDRKGVAYTLALIGMAHEGLGEWQQALDCHKPALEIFQDKEIGERVHVAYTLTSIGTIYNALGEWQQALDCDTKALAIFKEIGHFESQALSLASIGMAHEGLGEWQQALDCLKPALEIFQDKEIGERVHVACALNHIGTIYNALGEPQQALESLNEAAAIFHDLGNRAWEIYTLKLIAATNEALEAKSLDKLSPDALLSPGDTTTQEGMEPETEHMDADGQRVVESFERLPPAQRQEVLAELVARVETANEFKQAARAVLLPPVTPEEIANIPQWRGRKLDGPATDFLEKHYGKWLAKFGGEQRVFQDQIRHHNLELIHGLQSQLWEAGKGEKVRDYLPTRSARTDAVIKNYPEAAVTDPRIGARVYYRARRAAKLHQPRI
jgi:tetratricopeptide (TPR) repeat protein